MASTSGEYFASTSVAARTWDCAIAVLMSLDANAPTASVELFSKEHVFGLLWIQSSGSFQVQFKFGGRGDTSNPVVEIVEVETNLSQETRKTE